MKTIFLGKNCIEVEQTDSTNSYLAQLASQGSWLNGRGAFEGTAVIARHQLRGRGQRDASWESEPAKNLTLSILLYPDFLKPEEQFQLNKVVSLGVAEFVADYLYFSEGSKGEDVKIKWPNDIYVSDKKIAGILIENSVSGAKLLQSVVGIGININQEKFSAGLPNPTSLKLITGNDFDLKECFEKLCSCVEKRYLQLRNTFLHPNHSRQEEIDHDYSENLYRFAEWARYKYKEATLKAQITGITKTGKLVLETSEKRILECDFKDVSFLL